MLRTYPMHKNQTLNFWHLRRDGVWEIPEADRDTETVSDHAHVASLRREGARGGLPANVFQALRQDRITTLDIVHSLLDAHFPNTLHDDILSAVGINIGHAESAVLNFDDRKGHGPEQDFEQVRRRSSECRQAGYEPPVICTPSELMETDHAE